MEERQICHNCLKLKAEVRTLVHGEQVSLCRSCIRGFTIALSTHLEKVEKEKQAEKNSQPLPSPVEIVSYLDGYVIGQEKAKRSLAVALYQHYKRKEVSGAVNGITLNKSNVIVHGPSGTGKTLLLRTAARLLDVPIFVGDATRFTAAGYVGDDVEALLQGLYREANRNRSAAEWGIVVVDEIDKVRRYSGRGPGGFKDVSGESVQQALLKIMEGGTVTFPEDGKVGDGVTLDTTNILFVFLGSFAGIEEVIERRLRKNSRLGFQGGGGGVSSVPHPSNKGKVCDPTQEDFLEYGMIPEFVGRVPIRTGTVPLTVSQIRSVLTDPKDAIVKQKQAMFSLDGITLNFTEEALQYIAEKAFSDETGVRACARILDRILEEFAFRLPKGKEILMDRETVESLLLL